MTVSVRKAMQDVRKAGQYKKPSGMLGGTRRLHSGFRTMPENHSTHQKYCTPDSLKSQ